MGEHPGTDIEGTVKDGIIRPMGIRGEGAVDTTCPVTESASSLSESQGLVE